MRYCCLSRMTTLEPLSAGFMIILGFWISSVSACRCGGGRLSGRLSGLSVEVGNDGGCVGRG